MAEKLKSLKIKRLDGSFSPEIPIAVEVGNVEVNDSQNLNDVLANIEDTISGKADTTTLNSAVDTINASLSAKVPNEEYETKVAEIEEELELTKKKVFPQLLEEILGPFYVGRGYGFEATSVATCIIGDNIWSMSADRFATNNVLTFIYGDYDRKFYTPTSIEVAVPAALVSSFDFTKPSCIYFNYTDKKLYIFNNSNGFYIQFLNSFEISPDKNIFKITNAVPTLSSANDYIGMIEEDSKYCIVNINTAGRAQVMVMNSDNTVFSSVVLEDFEKYGKVRTAYVQNDLIYLYINEGYDNYQKLFILNKECQIISIQVSNYHGISGMNNFAPKIFGVPSLSLKKSTIILYFEDAILGKEIYEIKYAFGNGRTKYYERYGQTNAYKFVCIDGTKDTDDQQYFGEGTETEPFVNGWRALALTYLFSPRGELDLRLTGPIYILRHHAFHDWRMLQIHQGTGEQAVFCPHYKLTNNQSFAMEINGVEQIFLDGIHFKNIFATDGGNYTLLFIHCSNIRINNIYVTLEENFRNALNLNADNRIALNYGNCGVIKLAHVETNGCNIMNRIDTVTSIHFNMYSNFFPMYNPTPLISNSNGNSTYHVYCYGPGEVKACDVDDIWKFKIWTNPSYNAINTNTDIRLITVNMNSGTSEYQGWTFKDLAWETYFPNMRFISDIPVFTSIFQPSNLTISNSLPATRAMIFENNGNKIIRVGYQGTAGILGNNIIIHVLLVIPKIAMTNSNNV